MNTKSAWSAPGDFFQIFNMWTTFRPDFRDQHFNMWTTFRREIANIQHQHLGRSKTTSCGILSAERARRACALGYVMVVEGHEDKGLRDLCRGMGQRSARNKHAKCGGVESPTLKGDKPHTIWGGPPKIACYRYSFGRQGSPCTDTTSE